MAESSYRHWLKCEHCTMASRTGLPVHRVFRPPEEPVFLGYISIMPELQIRPVTIKGHNAIMDPRGSFIVMQAVPAAK
ncbi:hypothetical protein NDU88_008964 [Pleurodeles waltl]|uniref:Uncharacterized protein n=1 Tax=Pleurodeles waltl TaxID=8319 RepID=A0AAV7PQW5_PLEWA|nr:hypothetical protein NDU88_008964 [Pleurodeles waltl]